MIKEATKAAVDQYANVKSGFGIEDVICRLKWNAENKISWYVYKIESEVVGWVNMNWGGMKGNSECPE